MLELGENSLKYHQEIIDLLINLNIKNFYFFVFFFKKNNYYNFFFQFNSIHDCRTIISQNKIQNSLILIKGSRKIQLEKLTKWL